MTENDLLAEPLKGEWGFDGVVVSDWGALYDGEPAARAALDLTMPGPEEKWGEPLVEAVRAGRVPEAAIDAKVRRLLLLAARAGALDGIEPGAPKPAAGRIEDAAPLAREAAPRGSGAAAQRRRPAAARRRTLRRVAVVGPGARDARPLGGGSASVPLPYVVTPVAGLTRRAGRPGRGGHRRRRDAVGSLRARAGRRAGRRRTGLRRRAPALAGRARRDGRGAGRRDGDDRPACSTPSPRARRSSRSTPASSRTRTATGGSASIGLGPASSRSTARPWPDEVEDAGGLRHPPDVRRAAAARRRSCRCAAGQRVDVRIRYRWPAEGFIFRVGLVVGPPAAAGRRGARPRRRAGAHQRRRGRGRRHQRGRGERGLRPDVAGAARPAGRARPRRGGGQPAHRGGRQRRRPGGAAVARRGVRRPGVLVPGHGVRQRAGRRPARRRRARRPAAHHVAGRDGRRAGARGRRPPTAGSSTPRVSTSGTAAYLASGTEPAYWFGHGLGYTTWDVRVDRGAGRGRRRTGLDGHRPGAQHRRPARQAGRAGLRLAPGLRRRRGRPAGWPASPSSRPTPARSVDVPVDGRTPRALRHWDVEPAGWAVEPGDVVLSVGASAGDVRASATVALGTAVSSRALRPAGRAPGRGRSASGRPRRGCPGGCRTAPGSSAPTGSPADNGWDSGWVDSDQSLLVPYAGPPLASSQRVEWRVQVRDRPGREPGVGAGLVRDRAALGRGLAGLLGRARPDAGRRAGRAAGGAAAVRVRRRPAGRVRPAARHRAGPLRGVPQRRAGRRRRADARLHPVRRAAAGADLRRHRRRPRGAQRARRRPRRRLVPRADRHHPLRRPVGQPAGGPRPAAPGARRRLGHRRRHRAGLAQLASGTSSRPT